MEIKTVSAGPRWENHLHRPSFHLHGHCHGYLRQVLFNLHCNLLQNLQSMGIHPWFKQIFWKDIKSPFPMPMIVSTQSPTPLNYEETHGRRCFNIELQNSLIYYEQVLAKLSQRHFCFFTYFSGAGMKVACNAVSWARSDILKLIWTQAAAISKPRTRLMIACLTAKNFCSA